MKDFITRLLIKDAKKRLGSGPAGVDEIKKHALFKVGGIYAILKETLAVVRH